MSEGPKYQANFSGQFTGSQVAMGENNRLQQRVGLAAAQLDPDELTELARQLTALKGEISARTPETQRAAALEYVAELEQGTLSEDHPQPGALARVYRWFVGNVPDLAETVSTLLLGPLVGKLVGGGAGAMAAAMGADLPRSETRGH
jgi:hypothetical protein